MAVAMKKSTLVTSLAVVGLLGLFTSGCSDENLACSEIDGGGDAGAADGASGNSAVGNGLDASGLADAVDAPAAAGGAGADGGGDSGLDLGSVAGDGPGGLDTSDSGGPDT
jgi:hypothetical protein